MFCYQCEQTKNGAGCTAMGVCGKDDATAALQDLLVHATKGISMYARRAAQLGAADRQIDRFVIEALFATVTNVDFDPTRLRQHLDQAAAFLASARAMYEAACKKAGKAPEALNGPAAWKPAVDLDGLIAQGQDVGISGRKVALGDDAAGLQELILYGLKGAAAYADHAQVLGKEDPAVY